MDFFLISSANLSSSFKMSAQTIFNDLNIGQVDDKSSESAIIFSWKKDSNILCWKNERFELLFDGYLKDSEYTKVDSVLMEKALNITNSKQNFENNKSGIYNIIIRDKLKNKLIFTSDPSSLFPLFYTIKKDQIFIGSHSHLMGKILDLDPDPIGIAQKIAFGYSLGERTYYKDLFRLNPSEIIEYDIKNNKIHKTSTNPYFSEPYSDMKNPEEILFEALYTSLKSHRQTCENFGLMLSEGFDSRLIGGLAQKAGFNIYTFTHGTPMTKGSLITKYVANSLNAKYYFDSLQDGFPSNPADLNKQLLLADNLNISYWIHGSKYFNNLRQPLVASAGTALDSTIGGHIFYKPSKPKINAIAQRYFETFGQSLNFINDDYIENLSDFLIANYINIDIYSISLRIKNAFSEDIAHWLLRDIDHLKDSVYEEFARLNKTGSLLSSQSLQRFFLENRVRKFSFGQEMTLRMYNRLIVPSYEYSFMSLASKVKPSIKLHHKLYLKLLKKFFPELAIIKNGGYGLPATYPIVVLESSRFVLRFLDDWHMKKLMQSKGKYNADRFRAVLVSEFNVRNNKCLDSLYNLIEEDNSITNSNHLCNHIDAIKSYKKRAFNLGPIYDSLEYRQIFNKHI